MNRILTGGGVLLRRLTSWYLEERFLTAAGRVLGTIAGAGFAAGLLIAAPVLWWPVAGVWLIASWCAKPADGAAEELDDEEPDEDEEPDLDRFIATIHQLMPDKGRIHLATVAQHLATPQAAVREMCDAAGIPYGTVRVGRTSSTGVKREDLPPLSGPSPTDVVGVVAAGQSNNNNMRIGFYQTPDPDRGENSTKITWVFEPTEKAS